MLKIWEFLIITYAASWVELFGWYLYSNLEVNPW